MNKILKIVDIDYSHGIIYATDGTEEYECTWTGLLLLGESNIIEVDDSMHVIKLRFKEYRGTKYITNNRYTVGTVNQVSLYQDRWVELTDGYSTSLRWIDEQVGDITAEVCQEYLDKNLLEV